VVSLARRLRGKVVLRVIRVVFLVVEDEDQQSFFSIDGSVVLWNAE